MDNIMNDYSEWSQTKSPEAMHKLITHFDPAIRGAAGKVGGDDNVYNSLRINLARNMKNFDESRGDLKKFVNQTLRRAPRINAKQRAASHVPEASSRDISTLRLAERQLSDDNDGRVPTMSELARYTGISERRQSKLLKQHRKAPVMASSLDPEQLPALDDDRMTPEQQAWVEYTVGTFDRTDRHIYDNLSEGFMTPAAVAADLKISPAAVSQRIARINARISEVDFG